jgi:glycosyltransferase involved in cell wall biosynthesis
MACGTPVISFDVGGVGELVRDGETGVLVPAGDMAELRTALRAAIRGDLPLNRFGGGARALVERNHTEAAAVTRHLAIYDEVLA